ncbi:MAG: hypothetical protein K6A44_07360 [bacterium]|nr:hypothetical protein [bacterium]
MLISNTFLALSSIMLGFMPLTVIPFAIAFIAGGFLFAIGYIILYFSQLSELRNEENG